MLDVKVSSFYSFLLLYDKEKVYLVNTTYTNSLFNFSKKPEKVILDAYLLDQQDISYFEVGNNKKVGTVSAVLITQPFVALIYNFGKYEFQNFGVSYSIVIKTLLLIIALTITLLSSRIYLKSLGKKIPNRIKSNNRHFSLRVYKPKDNIHKPKFLNEMLGYILGLLIIGTPLYLYFKINNGGESILLMAISAIFFFLYCSTKMSPIAAPIYKNYEFIIEKKINRM